MRRLWKAFDREFLDDEQAGDGWYGNAGDGVGAHRRFCGHSDGSGAAAGIHLYAMSGDGSGDGVPADGEGDGVSAKMIA